LAIHNYAQWKDGSQSFPFASFTLDSRGYAPILSELAERVPKNKLFLNRRVMKIDYRGKIKIRICLKYIRIISEFV
jgi:hypothetical protein